MDALEQRTMSKVAWRLVPFLMLCYFFCFLDRVNVGFAALQMNADLHFTASVFGFGAGILFVTYMLGETPSNLILSQVGPRPWIARIMVTWGLLASASGFCFGGKKLLCSARAARWRGGGLLPRNHILSDLLVPWYISSPGHRPVHGLHPSRVRDRLADIDRTAISGWNPRTARLAVAVPARGTSPDRTRHRHVVLSH